MRRVAYHLLVIAAAGVCGFTQEPGSVAAGPRIVIDLPDNIPPETVWVRYALYGPEGSGGRISSGEKLKSESPHYYISALFGGSPARHAKVVMYAPGCQFAKYDLDLSGDSDTTTQFQCDTLPTKAIRGFLHPDEIPSNTVLAEKKLDIAGYLDGDWVCEFFLQQTGGSCLGSDIPLGMVGELDPALHGFFDMTIPDFTFDPVFGTFARHGKFGVIRLPLKEKQIGRGLGTITAEKGPQFGLNVQRDYSDPVTFTRVH